MRYQTDVIFFNTGEKTHIPVIGHLVSALSEWEIPKNTSRLKRFSQLVEQALSENYSIHIFPKGALKPYATQLCPMKKGVCICSQESGSDCSLSNRLFP